LARSTGATIAMRILEVGKPFLGGDGFLPLMLLLGSYGDNCFLLIHSPVGGLSMNPPQSFTCAALPAGDGPIHRAELNNWH
jgi:hypothetical protein